MQTIDFDPRTDETPALICSTCYDKYYSLYATRDAKINSVLNRNCISKLSSKIWPNEKIIEDGDK